MQETLKKFSAEAAARIAKIFESEDLKSFIAKTKEATDSGTFEVVISTADIDRAGEVVEQSGWDLANYTKNPVVLWGHDYYSLPIGVADEVKVEDGKLVARGRFAPEAANPFAQQVRRLYDAKIVRATSVGFIVREMDGKRITKAELLEFSFVPVPANPFALSMREMQALNVDTEMLAIKGVNLAVKAEGDVCTLEDGTEGVIDAEGNCVPKVAEAAKAEGDSCTLEDGTEGIMQPNAEGALVCVPKITETSKAKGDLAEAISEDEMWEQKWANLDKLCDVIDAMFNVYLDKETPVEKFGELIAEMITLLQPFAGGTEAKSAPTLEAELESIGTRKQYLARNGEHILTAEEKAKLAENILNAIKQSAAGGTTAEGGEGEEHRDGGAPNERSRSAGDDGSGNLKDFLAARQLLREVATVVTDSLERMNKIARDKKVGK